MSAATQATPQVESNITSDRTDVVVGWLLKSKESEEKEPWFYEVDDPKFAKAKEDGLFTEEWRVTVSIPRAKNLLGIKEICPDEEEAAMNFNRGAKSKATNRLKPKLLTLTEDGQFKFDPAGADDEGKPYLTNGVLDMTADIASPSKRKVLTEEEKLDRFLEQFPEATRQMMKQAYLASRQSPAGAPVPALAG